MTIKELKEELNKYPDNMIVGVKDYESDLPATIIDIEVVTDYEVIDGIQTKIDVLCIG